MIQRRADVDLERGHDRTQEPVLAALVAVEEVADCHVVVHHRHDARVGGHVDAREALNEDVRAQAVNVAEERLQRGSVQAVGDR